MFEGNINALDVAVAPRETRGGGTTVIQARPPQRRDDSIWADRFNGPPGRDAHQTHPDWLPETEPARTIGDRVAGLSGTAKAIAVLFGIVSLIAVYLWDDALLAAPVIAVVAWLGPLTGYLLMTGVYSALGFAICALLLKTLRRSGDGPPGRFASAIDSRATRNRSRFVRRLLRGGSILGFVASCFLLGPIVTVWAVHASGRRDRLTALAVWASVIFAATFCAQYTIAYLLVT